MSYLRYYDEAVLDYFSTIEIEDGDSRRSPQVLLAIPSRQGVKLNITDDTTPVLPMLTIIRSGMAATPETNLVKSHVTRPHVYSINASEKFFEGVELMPYNFSYQIDFFSLVQDMHNTILEQILFKLHKHHFIKVKIDVVNHMLEMNSYVHGISFSDSTTYTQIEDQTNRLFHGVVNFNLYGLLVQDNKKTRTVLTETVTLGDLDDPDQIYRTIIET